MAGASIGAVIRLASSESRERYAVRSELFEFLNVVSHSAKETDSEHADRTKLIQIIGVSLEPNRRENAKTALRYMDPINQRHGFIACVDLDRVLEADKLLLRNLLNAGMTVNAVQRHDRNADSARWKRILGRSEKVETTYFVRSDLFKTLLLFGAGSSSLEVNAPKLAATLRAVAKETP